MLNGAVGLQNGVCANVCSAAYGDVWLDDAASFHDCGGGDDGRGVDEGGEAGAFFFHGPDDLAPHFRVADGADERVAGLNLIGLRCAQNGGYAGIGGRVGIDKAAHRVCPGVNGQVIYFAAQTARAYDDEILHEVL